MMPNNDEPMFNMLDLFAGAGGLSKGFEETGHFRVHCANEFEPTAAATYRLNHPGTTLVEGDITDPRTKDAICACFDGVECHVVAGGVPCQSWSRSGRRRGFDDERGRLWFDYIELVRRLRPRMFVAENVAGLEDFPGAVATLTGEFESAGYRVARRVLCAADFGVPQARRRLFFIGVHRDWHDGPILFPPATHEEDKEHEAMAEIFGHLGPRPLLPHNATGDVLSRYEDLPARPDSSHVFARHRPDFLERVRTTLPGTSVYPNFREAWFRLDPGRPAPTVKHNNGGVFIHPIHDRTLTPRELAALQGFPDDYRFAGAKGKVLLQIGNAVPVGLGRAVARAVLAMLAAKLPAVELARVLVPAAVRARLAEFVSGEPTDRWWAEAPAALDW